MSWSPARTSSPRSSGPRVWSSASACCARTRRSSSVARSVADCRRRSDTPTSGRRGRCTTWTACPSWTAWVVRSTSCRRTTSPSAASSAPGSSRPVNRQNRCTFQPGLGCCSFAAAIHSCWYDCGATATAPRAPAVPAPVPAPSGAVSARPVTPVASRGGGRTAVDPCSNTSPRLTHVEQRTTRPDGWDHSPVRPSIRSRRMSACPLCRAYSPTSFCRFQRTL